MPLTPADVRSTTFRLTSPGYDVEEVDAFLDGVESELTSLSSAVPERAPAAGPADAGPERAVRTLALAEELAERLLSEARAEVAGLHEAAERTAAQAQAEADAVLERASAELSRLDERRRELEARLDDLCAAERSSVTRLEQLMAQTRRSLDEQAA